MGTTFQRPTANLTTSDFRQPTGLILERVLSAETSLRHQEWTFGAAFVIHMAIVSNLRVTAGFRSFAIESTRRGLRTAWQRRLKDCPAAMTTDLIEDGLATSSASALMAKLEATVVRIAAL
jgi:hypothetical protein